MARNSLFLFHFSTETDQILNVAEGNSSTQTPPLSPEAAVTLNSNVTNGKLEHETIIMKKRVYSGTALP